MTTVPERGSFTYSNPPTIHWGSGSVAGHLSDVLDRRDARRVFLVTTRSLASNLTVLDPITRILGPRLVGQYGAIGQHAPARSISEAAAQARAARPDTLVSLGGGSPIDATKAIALNLATGIDVADPDAPSLAQKRAGSLTPDMVPSHIAIPTTLSVAELSFAAGFTTEGDREKLGTRVPALMPAAVLYDASLSIHTPLDLWLSTGIRAVDHAVEGMLAPGNHPFSDTMALEGLRRLRKSLLATHDDPADLEARTESQLGAWFSFTLPLQSAAGLSHTLGKRLGSRHGIPHGVTSCLLLPHVMRYLAPRTAPAQARIAEALGVDTRGLTLVEAANRAADAVRDLVAGLGLPKHLGAYNLGEADLVEAVRPISSEQYPSSDLLAILRAAL